MYFVLIRGPKVTIQRMHFPCELRADIYIFGISRAMRMGLAPVLIQIPTFVVVVTDAQTCILVCCLPKKTRPSTGLGSCDNKELTDHF